MLATDHWWPWWAVLVAKYVKVRILLKRIKGEELEFCYKVEHRNRAILGEGQVGVKRGDALSFFLWEK